MLHMLLDCVFIAVQLMNYAYYEFCMRTFALLYIAITNGSLGSHEILANVFYILRGM